LIVDVSEQSGSVSSYGDFNPAAGADKQRESEEEEEEEWRGMRRNGGRQRCWMKEGPNSCVRCALVKRMCPDDEKKNRIVRKTRTGCERAHRTWRGRRERERERESERVKTFAVRSK
jgi:hypothetical protein